MFDFFVSYNEKDADWAQWLAWQIEEAGYTTVIQAWDIATAQDFVRRMDDAITKSARLLMVLSPTYQQSPHANAEWRPFYKRDPNGDSGLILPVRVQPCESEGLLGTRVYVDMLGATEQDARRALLEAVRRKEPQTRGEAGVPEPTVHRKKPATTPSFPGHATPAPARAPVDYSHLKRRDPPLEGVDDELFSIAFSRDGHWLAAGSNKTALLWNLDQPNGPKSTRRHGSYVYSIAFSHDSQRLVTGGEDGYVRVWDVAPLKLVWQERQHREAVYSVAFSRDRKLVASGGYDGKVLLWDAERGQPLRHAGSAVDAVGRVTSVAFSPDDSLLAIGSLKDTVTLLDIVNGTARVVGEHKSSVEGVAFAPDGRLLASCGLDKAVCVWKVDDLANPLKWRKREHEYLVRSVAFSPDGKTLASVGWDKRLNLWDVDSGAVRASLPFKINDKNWHSDWIWSVAFSTEGMLLASSGSDGRIIVWQVEGSS